MEYAGSIGKLKVECREISVYAIGYSCLKSIIASIRKLMLAYESHESQIIC
jgi:hypothetical protein